MKTRELSISEIKQVSGGIASWTLSQLDSMLTQIADCAQQIDSVNNWQYVAANDPHLKVALTSFIDSAGMSGESTVAMWATGYDLRT